MKSIFTFVLWGLFKKIAGITNLQLTHQPTLDLFLTNEFLLPWEYKIQTLLSLR